MTFSRVTLIVVYAISCTTYTHRIGHQYRMLIVQHQHTGMVPAIGK